MGYLCRALLFLCCFPLAAAHAEVYRWVDEQGNVHFGDRPPQELRQRAQNLGNPSLQSLVGGSESDNVSRQQKQAKLRERQARLQESMNRDRKTQARYEDDRGKKEQLARALVARCPAVDVKLRDDDASWSIHLQAPSGQALRVAGEEDAPALQAFTAQHCGKH